MDSARAATFATRGREICEGGWSGWSRASVSLAGVRPSRARRFQVMVRKEFHPPAYLSDMIGWPPFRTHIIGSPYISRYPFSWGSISGKRPVSIHCPGQGQDQPDHGLPSWSSTSNLISRSPSTRFRSILIIRLAISRFSTPGGLSAGWQKYHSRIAGAPVVPSSAAQSGGTAAC